MVGAYHKLNQAKESFNKFTGSEATIICNTIEADVKLREGKFDLAKVKLQECLHSTWGKDNEVGSFCLERLADITAWPSSEWQFRWPVTYLGYAYKTNDNFALHKALLCLGDVFIINKDEKLLQICTCWHWKDYTDGHPSQPSTMHDPSRRSCKRTRTYIKGNFLVADSPATV
ncbi:hypothetical protein B0H14DRAFT_977957 [Mycena olivaceomarginata]|nr:hypothetical protein B0H14DRAFT_977957 [Mycena olivaceomarginata]